VSIPLRLAVRLYARLLRLYPRRFREKFADEMQAGLLVGLVTALAVRRGSFRAGLWASLAVIILAGLPIHYGSAYYPSPTFPAPANLGAVVQGSVGDLVGLALVGAPLWLLLAWRRTRRLAGT